MFTVQSRGSPTVECRLLSLGRSTTMWMCILFPRNMNIHRGALPWASAEAHLSTWILSVHVQTNNKSIGVCRCFVSVFLKYILFSQYLIQISCLIQVLLTESLQAVIVLGQFWGQLNEKKKEKKGLTDILLFSLLSKVSIHKSEHKIRNLSLLGFVCGQK